MSETPQDARPVEDDGYVEIWAVPAPPEGSRYRVLQDRWNEDQQTRTIFSWEPAP